LDWGLRYWDPEKVNLTKVVAPTYSASPLNQSSKKAAIFDNR
jgi:hypothetical protein